MITDRKRIFSIYRMLFETEYLYICRGNKVIYHSSGTICEGRKKKTSIPGVGIAFGHASVLRREDRAPA